jgi:hypothetical protein
MVDDSSQAAMGMPQPEPEVRPQEQQGGGFAQPASPHRRRPSESSRQAAIVAFLKSATLPAIAPMPGARAPRDQ